MIGRTNVGGGADLNFKVVGGTTEPSNPKENTIWVETEEKIPSWIFSAENPYIRNEDFYSKAEVKKGYYLGSTPKETASDNFDILYIALPPSATRVTILSGSTSASSVYHAWYDETGASISTFARKTGKNSYEVPEGAVKIGVSHRKDDQDSVLVEYYAEAPEGEIWVAVSLKSPVSFNALKKNTLMIYPLNCQQYIGGVWTDVPAKTYQSGAWSSWVFVLFDRTAQSFESIYDGLRCTDGNKEPTSTSAPITDADPFVKMTEGSSSNVPRAWQWEAPINFADYKTLEVYGYSTDGLFAIDDYLLGVGDVYDMGNIAKMNFAKTEQLHTMDISGIDVEGYLGFLSRNTNASTYVKYVRLHR